MGKTLRADIVIGGRADNSFYKLGNALETMGSQINLVSERLIQYGKESVEAYVSYEDAMLDAEVALRTQYETTSELGKSMQQLDRSALQWANDSRFTTEDVAGAISNAAHAGWDLQKMLTGVPDAMKISLAGGMELSEGLEYLVDISNAAGVGFDGLGELVDYWAFAANRSSTTIPELGQAMQKMGATMQFVKGDMAGLATMLAVLSNNGTKGTEAGSLLRNSLIRLIAPTKKAAAVMEGLELTAEDLDDIYSNSAGLEDAARMLQEAGFSAYDAQGDLKSFITIWKELSAATREMTEEDRNKILTAIFPTRTITGAMALIEAASKDWNGLYDDIRNGAKGYADYASETMESGLGGTLRHLESVYNALQTRTGSALSEDVGNVSQVLSGLIERVNGMDETSFRALVSGLEAVAVAGPGLMVAGGAIKLIGAIAGTGTVGKAILLGTGLAALAAGMHSVQESAYQSNFGNLKLDTGNIRDYLSTLDREFDAAQESIAEYNDTVAQAVEDYTNASGTLKEILLSKMLTGANLTWEDYKSLSSLGSQMREALIAGIGGSYSSAEASISLFAGDKAGLAEDADSLWVSVMDTLNYGYEQAIASAEQLGADLRSAMTSAFSDGTLTSEEVDNIQGIINQQNELLAMQTDAKNAVERQKMLRQAQTLGMDAVAEISALVQGQRDTELSALEDNYWQSYYQTQLGGQMKIRDGIKKADGTLYTQADLDRELEALYSGDPNDPTDGYYGRRMAAEADFDRTLIDLYESTALGSDLRDVWSGLGAMADSYLSAGTLTESALRNYQSSYDSGDRNDISRYLGDMIDALGGASEVQSRSDYYAQTGDLESANAFARLIAMYSLSEMQTFGIAPTEQATPYRESDYTVENAREQSAALEGQDSMTALAWQYMQDAMQTGSAAAFQSIMSGNVTDTGFQSGIQSIVQQLGQVYDLASVPVTKGLEDIQEYAAAYRLMFDNTINAEEYRIQVDTEVDKTALEAIAEETVRVDVYGDTTNLEKKIDAQDKKKLLELVDGNTNGLKSKINNEDGRTLVEFVNGDTNALESAINQYDGKEISVKVLYHSDGFSGIGGKFAEGGRATTASIFGEAGPEWAIPEQHTARTAELLNAAREASGFTWPELLSRNGGLNAGEKGTWTLVYSPTIVAGDATGVEQKLKEDKDRLEKWLRDRKLHDDVEVYA